MGPDTASDTANALRDASAAWRHLPWHLHLLAILLLVLLALLRWSFLRSPAPLGDEQVYLQAFEVTQQGGTPYDVTGFFYPLAFARVGGWLLGVSGTGGTLVVLRVANLVGLAVALWAATAWLPWSITRRWLIAATLLCLSPAVHAGLDLGNVSFFIVGLTLAALLWWPRRPVLAGLLLGIGVALKPIAAAAIPILLVHKPSRRSGRGDAWRGGAWRGGTPHSTAALTAAVTATLLLLPISGLREMLSQEMVALAYARSFSLQRLVALFGVQVAQITLTLAMTVVATVAARWRPMSSAQLLCFAIATITLVTPLVWNHTLIVALPIQGMALALAWQRLIAWQRLAGVASPAMDDRILLRRRLELICVTLGVVMMHAGTTAGFDNLRAPVQIVLLLAVGLTPAVVCAYVFRFTRRLELPAGIDRSQPSDR